MQILYIYTTILFQRVKPRIVVLSWHQSYSLKFLMLQFFVLQWYDSIHKGTASNDKTKFPRKLARDLIIHNSWNDKVETIFFNFSFFSDLRVQVIFMVSISKSKKITFCGGRNIDFSGCIKNQSFCNRDKLVCNRDKFR